MSDTYSTARISRGSIYLYVRMFITMWFNLWATRLVLSALGVDDMGVYGVVGGIVGLFSVLTGSVTSAVQRFLSYELGRGTTGMQRVFAASLTAVVVVLAVVLLLVETGGLLYLHSVANIPPERLVAAKAVFQFSALTCLMQLLTIPYVALILAHERMGAFSLISLVQVVAGWAVAHSLTLMEEGRRLAVYAALLFLAGGVVWMLYVWYCRKMFPESRCLPAYDRGLLRAIGKFAGIGTVSNMLQTLSGQGLVLIINALFGVALNAVYMIALQLKNAVLSFGMNIFKAISPQITKTYAARQTDIYRRLVCSGSKAEVYMVLLIFLPFLFKTDYILHLWLGNVPEHTVAFCRCCVVLSVIYAAFEPIRTAVYAVGRIGRFLLVPDAFYFVASLGAAYLVGSLTGKPGWMIFTVVMVEIVTCSMRVWYAAEVCRISLSEFFSHIFCPCLKVGLAGGLVCFALSQCFADSLLPFVCFLGVNSLLLMAVIWLVGLSPKERSLVRKGCQWLLNRLLSRG